MAAHDDIQYDRYADETTHAVLHNQGLYQYSEFFARHTKASSQQNNS